MVTRRGSEALPATGRVLLDSCVAINLYATGRFLEIAQTLEKSYLMVAEAARETLYIEDLAEGELVRVRVDLDLVVAAGFLSVIELDTDEIPSFVKLAAVLDDGEAATMAVAQHRNLELATDDRKARRIAIDRGLPAPIGTTDLLFEYATRLNLEEPAVGELLLAVQQKARYHPRSADSRYRWWNSAVASAS